MDVMHVLRNTQIQAPVNIGDVIAKNVCGSDIIVTKAVYYWDPWSGANGRCIYYPGLRHL